jgi:hypothetical protein
VLVPIDCHRRFEQRFRGDQFGGEAFAQMEFGE